MFYFLSLIAYLLFFIFLTWRRFHWGLILFFALLPTYLIRFHLGPIPTTLLEMMLWIIFIIWLIKYKSLITNHLSLIIHRHLSLFIAILLFIIAATISVFTSLDLRAALGEWKAFYVEPVIIFLILITTMKQNDVLLKNETNTKKILNKYEKNTTHHILFVFYLYFINIFKKGNNNPINTVISALIICGLATSIIAIIQHFTGWLVPYSFWQNQNTFRVTAWYGFPNAVGLFLAPLIPLAIYLLKQNWTKIINTEKQETNKFKNLNIKYLILSIVCILYLVSSILAIIFSKSTGALVGLAAGIGFLLLLNKKTRWPALAVGLVSLIGIVILPSLSGIKQELLLQDRSGQIRLSIWNETWQFVKDNPISGAGLASYAEKIKPYHTTVNGEGIEIFHHPHNIFLTMWVNLGLLGLIAFAGILISIFNFQFSIFKQFKNLPILNYFVISSLIIIIIMGLVDSPYIKNDLSLFFWLLPALLILNTQTQSI